MSVNQKFSRTPWKFQAQGESGNDFYDQMFDTTRIDKIIAERKLRRDSGVCGAIS